MDGPLISVEALAAAIAAGDPHAAHRRLRWYLGNPARGVGPTTPGICRAPSSSTSMATWRPIRRSGPGAIRSPTWGPSPPARGGRDRRTTISSWPTTTSVAGSPRACGGCSTTSGTSGSSVLDGGLSMPGRRPAMPLTTDVPAAPPASLTLRDRWTRTIDRDALRDRLGSVVLLDARGAAALPRRDRADRRLRRPHPDRHRVPRPTATSPPTAGSSTPAELADRYSIARATAAGPEVVASCGSGVAAATTRSPCASPACPTRSSTPARTATGPSAGYPVATGPDPGDA